MANEKRKRRIPIGRILLFCLLLAGAYVGVQLYRATNVTYEYETAVTATMSDSIEVQGIVLFEETPVEGGGALGYLVADGARVSAGTQLAEVYTSDTQANVRAQLDGLDAQISLLEKSENASSAQVEVLLNQRNTAIYEMLESVERGSFANISTVREAYLLAQNKLQITTGVVGSFAPIIAQLRSQRDTLAQELSGLESISAPVGGYFVSSTSTQLRSVASQDVLEMDAPGLHTLLADGAEAPMDGMAGKIISSYTWTFCGVCTTAQSAKFADRTKVNISFPGKAETRLPATILSVEADEASGLAKFTLQCEYVGAEVLKLGQETAQLDFDTYTGLRISASAVHMELDTRAASAAASAASAASAPAADSAVPAGQDYVAGVYVKYGNLARFRRITVLYQDTAGYILIEPDGSVGTENEVRLYDEIIVAGSNLYDGKLL